MAATNTAGLGIGIGDDGVHGRLVRAQQLERADLKEAFANPGDIVGEDEARERAARAGRKAGMARSHGAGRRTAKTAAPASRGVPPGPGPNGPAAKIAAG
jgi:hypothetical protein